VAFVDRGGGVFRSLRINPVLQLSHVIITLIRGNWSVEMTGLLVNLQAHAARSSRARHTHHLIILEIHINIPPQLRTARALPRGSLAPCSPRSLQGHPPPSFPSAHSPRGSERLLLQEYEYNSITELVLGHFNNHRDVFSSQGHMCAAVEIFPVWVLGYGHFTDHIQIKMFALCVSANQTC